MCVFLPPQGSRLPCAQHCAPPIRWNELRIRYLNMPCAATCHKIIMTSFTASCLLNLPISISRGEEVTGKPCCKMPKVTVAPTVRCWKRSTHVLNFRRTAFLRAEKKLCLPGHHTIVAALSDYVRQQFVRHYGLSDQRIALIPNGIQVNRAVDVSYADAFRRDVLSRLSSDIRPNAVLFLFAATNFRLKGLRELLLAFAAGNIKAILPFLRFWSSPVQINPLVPKIGTRQRD